MLKLTNMLHVFGGGLLSAAVPIRPSERQPVRDRIAPVPKAIFTARKIRMVDFSELN